MRATFDCTGEVLVVTGGANGIGAALAAGFADAGGTVAVLDVAVPATSAPNVHHYPVDVSRRDAVETAVADVVGRFGRLDALVAGAAIQPRMPVAQTPEGVWRRTIEVNLNGVVWVCQAVVPHLVAARCGSIVVFASGLVNSGHAEASAYAATKGALVPFAKSLAAELRSSRVRVNVIFPGVVDTDQFQIANPPGPERDLWERTTGIGAPEDVVGPLMFLLSDAATMTGSILTRERAFSKEDQ